MIPVITVHGVKQNANQQRKLDRNIANNYKINKVLAIFLSFKSGVYWKIYWLTLNILNSPKN